MRNLARRLASLGRNRDGAIAIETAVLAPVAVLMLVGLVDHGLLAQRSMALTAAARSGVQAYMQAPGTGGAGIARSVALAALPTTGSTPTATAAQSCECPGAATGDCATLVCTGAPRAYLTVTVAQEYSTLMRYPWLPSPTRLSGRAVLRVR
ncbi:MAG TPA: TadE/TadG family type IV pilus assembly protein [Azospirillaceae bacterium]|nr:TadE/TadG family type IV pilus assembly protein [Azospirillaceae bacterium]